MSQTVVQLISQLRKKNIQLKLAGEKLKISAPPGALNAEIKAALKENKNSIVEFLKSAQSGKDALISPVERGGALPQSLAQERLWVMHQLQPDSSYNMAHALKISGPLVLDTLQQAFQAVVNRHESLRTSFATQDDGEPVQLIVEQIHFDLPLIDLSELDEAQQPGKTLELAQQDAQTTFDLHQAPLLRAKALKLGQDAHVLLFSLHHIIADGWSLGILVRDVMQSYGALKQGSPGDELKTLPLPALSIQYADYAQWQRQRLAGESGREKVAYWQKALAGVPELLDLPTDKTRPEQQSFQGAAHHFSFGARESVALKQCAQQHDITVFMLLLAGFQVLLGRLSQQDDVCVGVPVSGRDNAQTHPLIGFFINALVLRGDIRGNPTVEEYLQRVRKNTLGAFENQDVPMEEVLKQLPLRRNAAFNPGAQVGFSWQAGLGQTLPEEAMQSVAELSVEAFDVPQTRTIQDLTLSLWEGETGIEGRLEYATDLFQAETISHWADYYQHLLGEFVQQPKESISNLELLPQDKLLEELAFDSFDVENILPLSPMQRDIYLDAIINPQSIQNSMAYALPLQGIPDITRWQQALDKLVAAEPMLRTGFKSAGHTLGDRLYQVVKKHNHHDLHILDWRKESLEEEALGIRLNDLLIRPYDIHQNELFAHYLIFVDESHYVLAASTHHINSDGVGMSAHVRKWLAYYESQTTGDTELFKRGKGFQQQVAKIRAQTDRQETLDYWREKFQNVEPLVFSLPSQKMALDESERVTKKLELSDSHWRDIQVFCRKQRIVPALLFKVLYGYLIKQYCRPGADFDITEFNAGRNQSNSYDLGIYYHQQPIIFTQESLRGEKQFIELLSDARQLQKQSKPHRYISISQKLRLSQPGPLIFTYNYYHFSQSGSFEGKDVSATLLPPVMDQSVQFVVNQKKFGINLTVDYNKRYFRDFELLTRLSYLSEQVLKSPDIKLHELEIILPHERELFFNMNALAQRSLSNGSVKSCDCVQTLFEEQALKTADAIALRYKENTYTYR